MKHLLLKCALLVLTLCIPLQSQAVEPRDMFVGIHYGLAEMDSKDIDGDSPDVGMISLGYQFTRELAVEGRIGAGFELFREADGNELDGIFGLYLRAHVPAKRAVSLYGIAGYGMGRYTLSNDPDAKGNGLSFGGGLALRHRQYSQFVFEIMRFDGGDTVNLDTYSLGFRFYY